MGEATPFLLCVMAPGEVIDGASIAPLCGDCIIELVKQFDVKLYAPPGEAVRDYVARSKKAAKQAPGSDSCPCGWKLPSVELRFQHPAEDIPRYEFTVVCPSCSRRIVTVKSEEAPGAGPGPFANEPVTPGKGNKIPN